MNRIYHTWDKWECYPAGFYENKPPKEMTKEDAEIAYKNFLSNIPLFKEVLELVLRDWVFSCEHYLSNSSMNRIAWLGQASVCYKYGIPSCFRNGYNMLSEEEKKEADLTALNALNDWLDSHNEEKLPLEKSGFDCKVNLY
jgi:hypothetical protein